MRSKLLLLAIGLCLVLLSAAALSASPLILEEAGLYAYSDPYELHAGADGDVYVSDVGVGVWHVSSTGSYTTYVVFADVVDARPDAAGDVWYTDATNVVSRLNLGEPVPTVTQWVLEGTFGLWGLAPDDSGGVWIVQEAGPDLYRFDPASTELCTYTVDAWSTYVLFQDGDAWLANWGTDRIRRVDPSGQITSWAIPWSGARPLGLATDGQGNVWWADRGLAALVKLDPATNEMSRYGLPLGTRPRMVHVRGGEVWYTEWTLDMTGTVGIVDPAVATPVTATVIPVPGAVTPLCSVLGAGTTGPLADVDAGTLTWTSGTLLPLLDQDGWVIYELPAGSRPFGLAGAGEYVWLTDPERSRLARLEASTLPSPAIDLEKSTNGEDADGPPGPIIQAGDPVTWTYVVSNTGDVELTAVTVVDDNGTPSDPGDDYTCEIGLLPVGAADGTTCVQVGTATAGAYENEARVTGSYTGTTVTDTDLSHYSGVTVAVGIDLEKHTNGQDADDPPGPSIPVGDPVTWSYVVINTGDVLLTGVTVTDDNGTPADPSDDYVCAIGALPAGAVDSTTCSLVGVAVEGSFGNLARAEGRYGEVVVQDVDASHYVGVSTRYHVFLPLVRK